MLPYALTRSGSGLRARVGVSCCRWRYNLGDRDASVEQSASGSEQMGFSIEGLRLFPLRGAIAKADE